MVRNSSSNAAIIPIERNACRSCLGSRSGSGATLGRDDSRRWNSRTMVGAERIASPGVTPTAAAAIQAPVAVRDYEAELTCCERADVWSRRVLPVGARPGEGLLSQPTTVARPGLGNASSCP